MQARALQGETIDALCQRVLGRTAGVTEAVLDANPGLADLGPVLPMGCLVQLPESAVSTQTETALVQLWS